MFEEEKTNKPRIGDIYVLSEMDIKFNRDIHYDLSKLSPDEKSKLFNFVPDTEDRMDLFSTACKQGNLAACETLILHGANLKKECQGKLPIFHAAFANQTNTVKLIVDRNPEQAGYIYQNSANNNLTLHLLDIVLTQRNVDFALCENLISNEHCDINHQICSSSLKPDGSRKLADTPLIYCLKRGYFDLATSIINQDRVNLELKNHHGNNAFEIAHKHKNSNTFDEDTKKKYEKICTLIVSKTTQDHQIKHALEEFLKDEDKSTSLIKRPLIEPSEDNLQDTPPTSPKRRKDDHYKTQQNATPLALTGQHRSHE